MSVWIGLLAAVVVLLLVRRRGKGVAQEEGGWVELGAVVSVVVIGMAVSYTHLHVRRYYEACV